MFLFSKSSSSNLGFYKASYSIDTGVKRLRLAVGLSPPSRAEVNELSCTTTSLVLPFLNRVSIALMINMKKNIWPIT